MISKLLFALLSQMAFAEMTTVPYVDVNRYLGTWYQIARKPIFFENGCVCSRQVLSLQQDGTIGVYNSCRNETVDGDLRDIRGFATVDNPGENSRLTVDFGLPFKGRYWIIGLDTVNYAYAVVSDPNENTLYILSKTPQLESELYSAAVAAAALVTDTSRLELTTQAGCSYP